MTKYSSEGVANYVERLKALEGGLATLYDEVASLRQAVKYLESQIFPEIPLKSAKAENLTIQRWSVKEAKPDEGGKVLFWTEEGYLFTGVYSARMGFSSHAITYKATHWAYYPKAEA